MSERPAFEPVPFSASIHSQGPLQVCVDNDSNSYGSKPNISKEGGAKNLKDSPEKSAGEAEFTPICTCPAGFPLRYVRIRTYFNPPFIKFTTFSCT